MPPAFGTLLRGASGSGKFSTRMVGAERLLPRLPGVLSASIEGDIHRATEVRLLVEEDPPASEILEAVRAALDGNAAEFPLGAFFHIQVASVGDESPYLQSRIEEDPVASSPATPENGSPRLITYQVRDVSPGVIGVELTLGLVGHRFAGGTSGKANSPGTNRVPPLATLSALGSHIRFASRGRPHPDAEDGRVDDDRPSPGYPVPDGAGLRPRLLYRDRPRCSRHPWLRRRVRMGGAYHSTYWVDPVEELVVVYLTNLIPAGRIDDHGKLRALIYQALMD